MITRLVLNDQLKKTYRSEFDTSIIESSPYKYISLGTSHGINSIDFNYFGINGLNLAKAGQPYRYDLEKLDYYENLIGDNTLIIIPVSFHSLCLDESDWLPHEVIYNDWFPILGMPKILTLRTYVQGTGYNQELLENTNFNQPNEIEVVPTYCNDEIAIGYLRLILQQYKNTILITTPYLESYLGDLDDFSWFYGKVYGIAEEYDVIYLDYSRDERFQNHNFFSDATHLNAIGRRKFTNILFNDIESY